MLTRSPVIIHSCSVFTFLAEGLAALRDATRKGPPTDTWGQRTHRGPPRLNSWGVAAPRSYSNTEQWNLFMGIKRSECSDEEWGAKLVRAYDAAAASAENGSDPNHPRHILNSWLAIARGEAAENDEETGGGSGATDSARRAWAKASEPVRLSLDAAFSVAGRDASTTLALARAHMRRLGYDSPSDNLYRELEAMHASATQPRNAAASTRNAIAGYTRLR